MNKIKIKNTNLYLFNPLARKTYWFYDLFIHHIFYKYFDDDYFDMTFFFNKININIDIMERGEGLLGL